MAFVHCVETQPPFLVTEVPKNTLSCLRGLYFHFAAVTSNTQTLNLCLGGETVKYLLNRKAMKLISRF